MLQLINSAKVAGIEAVPVIVECKVTAGIGIHLVGLVDSAVKESLLRTVTALQASGYRFPGKKVVVNLAPADLHKSGCGYDLPIALAILGADGQESFEHADEFIVVGELGLDGSVRAVGGSVPVALMCARGDAPAKKVILAADDAVACAGIADDNAVYAVTTIKDVVRLLRDGTEGNEDLLLVNSAAYAKAEEKRADWPDLSDILGNDGAKRALEIAAAGGHHLLLMGPVGSPTTTLARALPGLLPPMTNDEAVTTAAVYSAAGRGGCPATHRPYRAPHYSASIASMFGGGTGEDIRPGEVSLAHNGVLYLDDWNSFPRSVMEALRGPLEEGLVTITRLRSKVVFPSRTQLVLGTNPCPCGYYGDGDRCTCTPGQRKAYLDRALSGPVPGRVGVQVWVNSIKEDSCASGGETTAEVAKRVALARNAQRDRYAGEPTIHLNDDVPSALLDKYCPLSAEADELLESIVVKMGLSARSHSWIRRIARTIADLEGLDEILPKHIAEAASYRFLDRI